MRWRADDFSLRYNLLFPAYAQLPPRLGYALAGQHAGLFRRKRAEEEAVIRTQMQGAFPAATEVQLAGWLNDYYRMVEQEALDTWYLQHQPIQNLVDLQGFEAVAQARRQGKRVLLTGGISDVSGWRAQRCGRKGLPQGRLPVTAARPISMGYIRRNTVTAYSSYNVYNRRWAGRFWWKGMNCARSTVR